MSEPIPHEIRVALAEAFTRILNARDPEAHWEPVLYDDESDAAPHDADPVLDPRPLAA